MPQWQKPENALRRANELLEVGKKQDALDTLHDVIKARKHRTWTKVHELIMAKHLDLCVELRKPHLAKDGLFQYRNMCQQVNVKSLEDVVSAFLEQAERKADQARVASQGLVEDVAEDLDQAESPERLLLSAVSGEGAQDRADRAVLSPWLRFLWESYRQCLELLRNNAQVEQLYHKVAKQAFNFCLNYQRRAEFRKLCDNLRTHVNQLQKSHTAHYAVKLSNPETLAMHQETRLTQLDVAIKMELWQEAYKSAEDVHQLMQSAKRSAKAQTLASYYERLALIFWKAGNTLYHTAALFKLFQLHKDLRKSFTNEEATHLATRVLLATLSIRWSDQVHDLARHLEMDEVHLEHQRRLASLLSWPTPPTRQFLLKEMQRVNVIGLALQPAQQLYQWLETEFSPLKLAPEIQGQLDAVKALEKPEYTQYIDALQQVAALKILKQISQVYRSISLKRFLSIVPFFDIFRLERLIVAAGKKAQMQVRIDHRTGSVEFGVGEAMTFGTDESETVGGLTTAQLDVPVIQTMPSEHIRQYLQQMYAVLQDAVQSVDREAVQTVAEKLKNNAKVYEYHKNDHHKATLERRKRIEQYKETMEKIKIEQEEMTRQQEKKELEKRQREDQQRLAIEIQEQRQRQQQQEKEDVQRKVMMDRIDKMKDPKFRNLMKDLPDTEILDANALLQKQIVHMEQEKREQQVKMKQQEKKWDHYVRAIHQVEIPLRETEYKERVVKDRQMWEEHEAERVQKEEEEHFSKLNNHERLVRLETDAKAYLATIRETRAAEMQRRMEAWEKTLKETRERRLQERKDERKEKRRQEWLQAKEEAERMKKEEEERKKRELEEQTRRPMTNGEDGDRRKRFNDTGRRPQPRGDGEEGGGGADAEKWERAGPLQKEPMKKPGVEDEGGRRFGGRRQPGRADDEADGSSEGANAEQWRREAPPMQEEREPPRRPAVEDDRRFVRRQEPPQEDGGMPPPSDAGPWRRGVQIDSAPAATAAPAPAAAAAPPPIPRQGPPAYDGQSGEDRRPGPWRTSGTPEQRGADTDQWRSQGRQPQGGPAYEDDRRPPYGSSRGPPPTGYEDDRRPSYGSNRAPPPPESGYEEDRRPYGASRGGGPWRGGDSRGQDPERWREPQQPPQEQGRWERVPPSAQRQQGPPGGGGYEDDRRFGGRRQMGGDPRRGGGGPENTSWRRGGESGADSGQWRK